MGWMVAGGVRLYYQDTGTAMPPLLFIHGGGCDHTAFAPQVDRFRATHRCVAVDLRGHGRSDKPMQEYTIRGFADDLALLCDRLPLRQPVLIAHSVGGKVALDVAARYPGLPTAIVAVESTLLPPADRAAVPPLAEALRGPGYREAAREFFANSLFLSTDDPRRKAALVAQMTALPQHVLASVFPNSFAWDGAPAAAACRVPLLLISGATVTNDLARLHALCPQLVHGQTVGAGHFNQLEVPDQVNAMIARFLAIALRQTTARTAPNSSSPGRR